MPPWFSTLCHWFVSRATTPALVKIRVFLHQLWLQNKAFLRKRKCILIQKSHSRAVNSADDTDSRQGKQEGSTGGCCAPRSGGCGGQHLPRGKGHNWQRKEWNVPASEMVLETADSYKNKKAKNKTKQSKTHTPRPQLKYAEAKCLFFEGFDIVALDGIGLFVGLQHQPAFQAFLWKRSDPWG